MQSEEHNMTHDHGRGTVNHSAVGALVTSPTFRCKTERPKKGKGSYQRKKTVIED